MGVSGGAKETAPPAMVWSPSTRRQASPGLACLVNARVPSSILVVPVSLSPPPPPPPPPYPFPRTTVLVPTLSLLTEEYFRDRSVHPYTAGPGRPGGCLNVSGPRPCPPPPLPIPWPSLCPSHLPHPHNHQQTTLASPPVFDMGERSHKHSTAVEISVI